MSRDPITLFRYACDGFRGGKPCASALIIPAEFPASADELLAKTGWVPNATGGAFWHEAWTWDLQRGHRCTERHDDEPEARP